MATTYRPFFDQKVSLPDYLYFLYLRIARIWPLYVVALLSAMLVFHRVHARPDVILANIFMVQGWGIASSINVPLWSVSAEFVAYLVFPFLFLFIGGARRARTLLMTAGAFLLIGTCAFINAHDPDRDLYLHKFYGMHQNGLLDLYAPLSVLPVLRCMAGFALGLVVWRLSRLQAITRLTNGNLFGLSCAALILLLTAMRTSDLYIYALFPPLLLSLSQDKGVLAKLVGCRAIRGLGLVSYAVYALQVPFFAQMGPWFFRLAKLAPTGVYIIAVYAAAMAGLLIVGVLAHFVIERPSRLALRLFINNRAVPAAA